MYFYTILLMTVEIVVVFILDLFDVICENISTALTDKRGSTIFVIKLIMSTNFAFILSLFFQWLAPECLTESKRAKIIKSLT